MADLLQHEGIKLYEYEAPKQPLEDELIRHGVSYEELYHYNHNHDPRNGQFTFSSSGGGSGSVSSKRKKKKNKNGNVQIYKSNEEAIKDKDYKYVNEHRDQFTSKEMKDLMDRIKTEERMDEFVKERSNSKTKKIAKDIIKSPIVRDIAISALAYVAYQYISGAKATPKMFSDKPPSYKGRIVKDAGVGVGKAVTYKIKKRAPI